MIENHPKGRLTAAIAIIGCFIFLAATPVSAQTAPPPKPPKANAQHSGGNRAKAVPVTVPAQASGAQAQTAPATPASPQPSTANFNPFSALAGKPSPNTTLNAEQRALVEKVNAYLSGTQVLSGDFVQVGPDGSRTKGDFVISKPGKVRFEYNDPNPIQLIADGQSLVVRDRNLATQDVYPLSQTPLRFLLSNRVDLLKDAKVIAASADDKFVTIVAEENNSLVGTSRLMIMFNAKDMQLKQWTVTDPQGYDTTVAVYNLDTSKKPDPSLFTIDYTNYRN